jgi:predicted Ser/Thr protein kinase
MALEDAEILLGKIAIGRSWMQREDAMRVARSLLAAEKNGRREPFHTAAVRLGYLDKQRADALIDLVRTGELVCRGQCGRRVRLAQVNPQDSAACAICGGPLYLAREAPGEGGRTAMVLEAARAAPAPAPANDGSGTSIALDVAPAVVTPHAPSAPLPAAVSLGPDGQPLKKRTVLDLVVDVSDILPAPAPTPRAPVLPTIYGGPTDEPGGSFQEQPTVATNSVLDLQGEKTEEWDDDKNPTVAKPAIGPHDATWRSPPPAAFEPFSIGEVQVLAPIGKGGMGAVYRGRWKGQAVAVKVLSASVSAPGVIQRFEREVKIATTLDSPQIVKVFAAGTVPAGPEEGKPYYVMEYVPGRDLAAWKGERPRPLVECVRMTVSLCHAMEHAHSRGVIHRDLKPGNVIVREGDDQPTVCDFGLARYRADVQGLTRTGDILGTPSYMAKEQALGERKKIGPPTDVYGLGAMLYFLITGKPPFHGATAFLTISKVIEEKPRPPRELDPKIPRPLEDAVLKALAKEPIDRFHTCADLRKALEAIKL